MLCYYDSSIILAILFDEPRKLEAQQLWQNGSTRVSSLLLKLETITVLRRTYEHNKSKLEPSWLTKKTIELDEFLKEVNFRQIDSEIEKIVVLNKELARCRTLDAIHLATAIDIKKAVQPNSVIFYTFDNNLLDVVKSFHFKTNVLNENNAL